MESQLEMTAATDVPECSTDLPFYLFGGAGRRAVPCRARWISDRYAYVVAPLATATAVRQQWEATAFVPPTDPHSEARQRHLQVELVSAETLLGADSGREGLLLRFLGSKPRSPRHRELLADAAGPPQAISQA